MTLAMDAMQHESRQQAQEQAQHLLYWQSALAASSLCIASSLSDDQTASCAGSSTSSSNDDDPLAKLQQFVRDSLNGMDIKLPAGMEDLQKEVNDFLASGKGGQISWGFMMGAFSGFTMKKLSKAGAVALGGVFILMQCASYAGYIDVNYQKLERDVMEFLDLNHDGKVDTQDANELFKSVMKVLEFSLPAGSGFAVGFLIGFRRG
ncbi:TPA: hypothetical protein N0F65_005757 [Lagenidium giganteum]|uniref:EF-hand domain-containing protein n=1 Tax=Lagenidium giganteum TaxID=4803 RepID=A0AAV2YZH4_9STRA|nr:TPA: hypothetical protein N0F65_005757 [Lagenidium giganteum]